MVRHPGQILREGFLEPLGISASRLAVGAGVHRSSISRLLAGRQPVTPAMAARLGAFFVVPAGWWLLMQAEYDAAAVASDPALVRGVTPMVPDPDVLLTPTGALRLDAPLLRPDEEPLSIPQAALDDLPKMTSTPTRRAVRTVRYDSGSIALVGDGS